MTSHDTIRLLILNDSRTEAERVISMLNNAGLSTRPQSVDGEEALVKLLQEHVWDLLIAQQDSKNLSPATAIRQIKRLEKDVATIIQTDESTVQPVVDALKIGAVDAVMVDDDQHLLLVIQRELENRKNRMQYRLTERRFNESEKRCLQLLDSSRDAIAYVQDGMFLYANQSFAECFGYEDADDIECMPVIDMVAPADLDNVKRFLKEFALKGEDAKCTTLTFSGVCENESTTDLNLTVSSAEYDEEQCIQFFIAAKQGNNEQLEAELQKIKDQDLVTGLFNRQYLTTQIDHEVARAQDTGKPSYTLYIELDNFEDHVQSTVGVQGADNVLKYLASMLSQRIRSTDCLARYSDDSFVLLASAQNSDNAFERAESLRREIEDQIIEVDGKTIQVTVSIGISVINESISKSSTVIEHAVQAIADGHGNSCKLFEPEANTTDSENFDLAQAIRTALDEDRFRLLFQPIVSLHGSEEEHYEVFVRMLDDEGNDIAPDSFLPTADKMKVLNKIDRWVIMEASKQLAKRRHKGIKTNLFINVSHQTLSDKSLAPWLSVIFKAADIQPSSFIFQACETDISSNLTHAKNFFDALRSINCHSSISHFGCALNPFKTLEHVNSDFIKLHGSFTQDIQNNDEGSATVSSLIKQLLGHNKVTIVPMVETASALSLLWQTGAHYIQGHYLQAPTGEMNYDFDMEG